MKLIRLLLLAALPTLLTACVNDGIAYQADNGQLIISLVREQPWFWDKKVNLSVVVGRLPACQRRHAMGTGSARSKVELWEVGGGTYILRKSDKMYVTEVRTCEGFAPLDEAPASGLGTLLGTFEEKNEALVFTPAATEAPAEK